MHKPLFDRIQETKAFLVDKGFVQIDAALVLGTGLGGLVDELKVEARIPYEDIPHFPTATVEFHSGQLLLGRLAGKRLVVMQGRFHYYEGHAFEHIAYGIRTFKALDAAFIIMSGAAGTMRKDWRKGDLMMINDHIHLLPGNPLIGVNDERLGPRFPDMSEAYDTSLQHHLMEAALSLGIELRSGVYVSAQGPMLETATEYRFLSRIGADAVGMSTTPEVIVANHSGIPIACVVVLTDECDPDDLQPIDIPELLAVAAKAEKHLIQLIKTVIPTIDAE